MIKHSIFEEGKIAGRVLWITWAFWLTLIVSPLKIIIYTKFYKMSFRYKEYYPILRERRGICFTVSTLIMAIFTSFYQQAKAIINLLSVLNLLNDNFLKGDFYLWVFDPYKETFEIVSREL